MRPHHPLSAGIIVLALVGCAPERANIAQEERAISTVVALLVGYESGGLASLLADLSNDSLTAAAAGPLVMHASSTAGAPSRLLVRTRQGAAVLGESRTRFAVRPSGALVPGAGEGVTIDIDGMSLHASSAVSIRATTTGTIVLASDGPLLERFSSGELRITGALGNHPGSGVGFTRIEVTLTWSHVKLVDGGLGPTLSGTIALEIAARGPGGLVIRNGALELDGDGGAMLDVTGRRFAIDIRRARVGFDGGRGR